MKKPIALISNDWHLEENNIEQITDVVLQKIHQYKSILKTFDGDLKFICLGDVFDSRKSQKETTLLAFNKILDLLLENGIVLDCIPGNHDKTDYDSLNSYLDVFSHHPALHLHRDTDYVQLKDMGLLFQPFISESKWIEAIETIKSQNNIDLSKTILLSHIAVNGSVNNDNTRVESNINREFLKDFRLTLLGHYHNTHEVNKNVIHLPSIRQKTFGEDSNKGFTILYSDFSYEIINLTSKEYITLSLESDKVDSQTINDIIDEYNQNKENVNLRVEFKGNAADIKSLDVSKLKANGIKLKFTSVDQVIQTNENLEDIKIVDFESNERILEAFEEFCKEKDIDMNEGLTYLKQVLK